MCVGVYREYASLSSSSSSRSPGKHLRRRVLRRRVRPLWRRKHKDKRANANQAPNGSHLGPAWSATPRPGLLTTLGGPVVSARGGGRLGDAVRGAGHLVRLLALLAGELERLARGVEHAQLQKRGDGARRHSSRRLRNEVWGPLTSHIFWLSRSAAAPAAGTAAWLVAARDCTER